MVEKWLIRTLLPVSLSLAVKSPKTETSTSRIDIENVLKLAILTTKMGYFCHFLTPISDILAWFLRGFAVVTFCLNMLEGRFMEIQILFYFVPYGCLEETGIEMSFLPFFGGVFGYTGKSSHFQPFSGNFGQK